MLQNPNTFRASAVPAPFLLLYSPVSSWVPVSCCFKQFWGFVETPPTQCAFVTRVLALVTILNIDMLYHDIMERGCGL